MVEREVVRARRKWWSFMIILNCGPFFFGGFCSWAGPSSGFGGRFFFGGAVLRMRIQTGDPRKALLYVLIGLRIRATSGSEEKKNMYVERENPQGEGAGRSVTTKGG